MSHPRRVVYTALIGGYEALSEPPLVRDADTDFVCFTDDPELTSEGWQIRYVRPRFARDPIRSARFLKVLGPEVLGEYDESLWIDNSVELKVDANQLLDTWLAACDLGVPLHSYRESVSGEFDAVDSAGYDDPSRIHEQFLAYSAINDAVLDERPYWTALLARRHSPGLLAAMRLWFDHILRYSRRDQLSINFVLAECGLETAGFDIDNFDSEWHRWPVAQERRWKVTTGGLRNALQSPRGETGRLQNRLVGLGEQLQVAHAELAEARAEADRLGRIADAVAEERRLRLEAEQRCGEQLAEVHELYRSSRSWKLSAPVRWVSRGLRRPQ